MGCGYRYPNFAVRSGHYSDGWTFGRQRKISNLAGRGQATNLLGVEFREPYNAVGRGRYTVWPTARRGEPEFPDAPIHRHLVNSIGGALGDVELTVGSFGDSCRRPSIRQDKFGQGAERRDTSDSVSSM